MSNVKGKGQRLIPEELLKYLQNQKDNGMNITQLVDSNGNPRFIEGKGIVQTISGVTISYNKWSLCGTHLMFVIAGEVENGTTLSSDLIRYFLPEWIMNKISIIWANRIERKNIELTASDYTTQNMQAYLGKYLSYIFIVPANITLTAKRYFRIQFDLLIDSE